MPGDNARKIEKAVRLPCDCVAIDLEDGVALAQKAAAREVTAAALRGIDFGGRERLVRINPASSDLYSDDLRETILATPVRTTSHASASVTVCIGTALFDGHPDYQRLVDRACEALRVAQAQGGNRCLQAD